MPTQKVILKISAVIEPDEDGFHGYCPALKGLHVDGKTERETLKNLADASEVYIDSLVRHGDPLPIGPDLAVHVERDIPSTAKLRTLTIECPSLQMSGIS